MVETGDTASRMKILKAAEQWCERSLLADGALFSDEEIWTMVNLRALWVALSGNKVDLQRLESLGGELQSVEGEVIRLAAELFWVMYLAAGPDCIAHSRKTEIVRTVYEWSGQTLPASHPLLKEPDRALEGSPGLFFNARRGTELLFLIKAVVGVKKLGQTERTALLADPWEFGRMLDDAGGDDAPQLTHVIRHLLFPETFERLFTRRDKRRIVEAFSGIPRKEARRWSITRLDEELASIRKQMSGLYEETELSFLREPLVSTWRQSAPAAGMPASEQRFWVEKRSREERPDQIEGPGALGNGLWIPRQGGEEDSAAIMREVEPGDVVFHFTANEGIAGVSLVAGELEEDFLCPAHTRWEGEPGYCLPLEEFTEVKPLLEQKTLLMGTKFQDTLRRLAETHTSLFFNRQLTLNQGRYLSEAPEQLVRVLDDAYLSDSNRHLPHVGLPQSEDLPAMFSGRAPAAVRHPLAQVLAGASGTGKTYSAMVRAVEICDGSAPGSHEALMKRYGELQEEGRISLVTFHPSFEYGDFIERRDRETITDEDGESKQVEVTRSGLFKLMADRAQAEEKPVRKTLDLAKKTLWKITPRQDGDDPDVYQRLIQGQIIAGQVAPGLDFSTCNSRTAILTELAEQTGKPPEDETVSLIDQLVNQMAPGDLVILADTESACRAIGRISGSYRAKAGIDGKTYTQTRTVDWMMVPDTPLPWKRLARKAFLERPLYRIDPSLLKTEALGELIKQEEAVTGSYVLIIDEIGQGDIAQIFGELVTLIEPDKRANGTNPLSVTLPLSGERFSVPGNLYLIGTLNSADRLDAHSSDLLHRRFQFDELLPDPSLIRGDDQLGTIPDDEGGRIDLRSLMITINQRIEYLAGPEERLGQGYFMDIRSYQDLLRTIRARILPHLRALFEDDWRRIQLVFRDVSGDGTPNGPQVVSHEELTGSRVLGFDLKDAEPRTRFWLTPERDLTPAAFRKVYSDA
jgi:hypothetical protein